MLDHANLDAMADMGRHALQIGPADRCLLILPLFHVNGIVVSVVTPLLAGASVVIADRFHPATFFEVIEREKPNVLQRRADHLHHAGRVTGRRYPRHLVDAVRDLRRRPGLGGACWRASKPATASRSSRATACRRAPAPPPSTRPTIPRAGTVGKPFPGQQIRIVDTAGADVRTGDDGEVLIARPQCHARLSRTGPRTPPAPSSTAGCTPATSATSTPTAT